MGVLRGKICALLWGQRKVSDSDSETDEVPTLLVSENEEEEDDASTETHRPRRKRSEVHGTVPTCSSARMSTLPATGPDAPPPPLPRDQHGHPVVARTTKRDLTTDERYQYVAAVEAGKHEGKNVTEVSLEWGVGKNLYPEYTKLMKQTRSLESHKKGKVGRKFKVAGADYEKFVALNRKHKGDKTYRELAVLFKRATGLIVDKLTLFRTAKREKWQMQTKYTCPMLTDEQMEARRLFALRHCANDWEAYVDIDEKWFYTLTRKRKRKFDPGWAEEGGPGRTPIQSKSHIPKVMFTCAIARPNRAHKFDGRLGM